MPSVLHSLALTWDRALSTGVPTPGLLESLELHGLPLMVRSMAVDEMPDAGPRVLYAATVLGYLPGARDSFDDIPLAGVETEAMLEALSLGPLTPTRRMDALRALTTHRGHLAAAAAEEASLLHAWSCARLGWEEEARRVLEPMAAASSAARAMLDTLARQ